MKGLDACFASFLGPHQVHELFRDATKPVPNDAGIELLPLNLPTTTGASSDYQSVLNEDRITAEASSAQFESPQALAFVAAVFRRVGEELGTVLAQRSSDRSWIDMAIADTAVPPHMGAQPGPLGQARPGTNGYVPFGPLNAGYRSGEGRARVAPLPKHLQGPHVTLFGPADGVKMCGYAMNAGQRRLPREPAEVAELLGNSPLVPMWGADDEDSRTPLRAGILASLRNILQCMDGTLPSPQPLVDAPLRSVPIKRVPGLGMPCHWMRVDGHLVPLHLLDLCLHVFYAWPLGERALSFYIPKLENELEARYLAHLLRATEELLPAAHVRGSIRVLVILENPRAVFRLNEMMDELYPYFAGASLGWHDYVAAAARLFRNDPTYRMPAKADAQIVVRHIRESHRLLAQVVSARGGVAIGGMYGVLPVATGAVDTPTMQACLHGLVRDVVLQLRRGLEGFWLAHPDFVRIGMALVVAHQQGLPALRKLVRALVLDQGVADALCRLADPAVAVDEDRGLDPQDPLYPRALLAAELGGAGATIRNNHPDEVRYNSVQAMQYITDWLIGNGCVALPTTLQHPADVHAKLPVRVMDDLATTERSRWEVSLELQHGRLDPITAVCIAREELLGLRDGVKASTVPWHPVWSPVAYRVWLRLISSGASFEFAPELLLPFTVPNNRTPDAWKVVAGSDTTKYSLSPRWSLIEALFDACQNEDVVRHALATGKVCPAYLRSVFCEANTDASNDCGNTRTPMSLTPALAKAISATHLLSFGAWPPLPPTGNALQMFRERLEHTLERFHSAAIPAAVSKGVPFILAVQRAHVDGGGRWYHEAGVKSSETLQIASLSKPIGSAFAMETFAKLRIPLTTQVAPLLRRLGSPFEFPASQHREELTLHHLMAHCSGIKQHYVHSFPVGALPSPVDIMRGLTTDAGGVYAPVSVGARPDTEFAYSGGAFIVLQHVLELLLGQPLARAMQPFLDALGMTESAVQDDGRLPLRPGTNDDGSAVERRVFPPLAAGILCSARDVQRFLHHLCEAFAQPNVAGSGPISHDTAVVMLGAPRRTVSKGAREFMACEVGTGLFVAHAGRNRVCIHQGANEGYRALFVACYDGPARGAHVVCMSPRDASSIPTLAAAAREALVSVGVLAAELSARAPTASRDLLESGPQETRVNRTMAALLFGLFKQHTAPRVVRPASAPEHAWAGVDLCRGATVEYVSDDGFAAAENLVHPSVPHFDPTLFCESGKTMDSWESVRHNPLPYDECVYRLARPCMPRFAEISTMWHDGNQVPAVQLFAQSEAATEWTPLLPVTTLGPHSAHHLTLQPLAGPVVRLRVLIFPDGGLSRVRLYEQQLAGVAYPSQERYAVTIPPVVKATALFDTSAAADRAVPPTLSAMEMLRHACSHARGGAGELVNVMCGGRIRSVSNQHYGPPTALVSPCPPRGMFDGLETARARGTDLSKRFEHVVVELLVPMRLVRVDIDFTFFVNNNPNEMSIECELDGAFHVLMARQAVKCYRANTLYVPVPVAWGAVSAIRVCAYPCGGFHRVRAQATVAEVRAALVVPKL